MDGLMLYHLIKEMAPLLQGGRISKIHQPLTHQIQLTIRAQRKNHVLLISADPTYQRIHLSQDQLDNPTSPPNFCLVLRKHLEGGILEQIKQVGTDRWLKLMISHRDELGDRSEYTLIVELMGRYSNIILLNKDDKILAASRYVDESQNRYRAIEIGEDYIAPPASKKRPVSALTARELDSIYQLNQPISDPCQWLMDTFEGISRNTANEILAIAKEEGLNPAIALKKYRDQELHPVVYQMKNRFIPQAFTYFTLGDPFKHFASLSEAYEWSMRKQMQENFIRQSAGQILQVLTNHLSRSQRKLEKLVRDLKETEGLKEDQLKGELLTANIYSISKGQSEVSVTNYYDNNQLMTIPIDPLLSPADNAQRYFKRYQKRKSARLHLDREISKAKEECQYLETVLEQIHVSDLATLLEIRDELEKEGYIKRSAKKKKVRLPKSMPLKYRSPSGQEVLVGRNNRQNDQLTFRIARKDYWWFHVKDMPGSHVVLMAKEASEEDILFCCQLAAYYSKARYSNHVPVDYLKIKGLNKPVGGRLGFVTYHQSKNLSVSPIDHRE